jgi:hypothetical protein
VRQRLAPLADGLRVERNLFMNLCGSDEAIARMRPAETLWP